MVTLTLRASFLSMTGDPWAASNLAAKCKFLCLIVYTINATTAALIIYKVRRIKFLPINI